jgi:hypothetical protein
VEALWQDVDQKTADELVRCERHHLLPGGTSVEQYHAGPFLKDLLP